MKTSKTIVVAVFATGAGFVIQFMVSIFTVMETKYSSITTIITVCLIVVTAMVIATMDTNTTRNLYEGLVLLCCVILFAGSVILRESIK